jgi:thiol:disulfide interchange protein DsbC
MSSRAWILLLALVSATASFTVGAKDPRAEIAAKIPGGAKAEELKESPIPGVYELARGTDIAYVSADGKYAIAGDLYEMESSTNLTEKSRRSERVKLLASMPESQMVVFAPKDTKYTVSVFTDIDCNFCRKLHSQMAEYNRMGVKVRYLFYPRSGPNTESWTKAEEVWCSNNKGDAMTRAKRGEAVRAAKSCSTSPVARQYELGNEVGVRGTPAILLENGEMLPGYLPPQQLLKHLKTGR